MAAVSLRRPARAPSPSGPSDRALDRLAGRAAVALRLSSAVTCAVAGPLAATAAGSGWLLGADIAVLWAWSAVLAWRVLRRGGLTTGLVLADLAVVTAIVATQAHVVPAALTANGTTWMLPLASTVIYISQLAPRPAVGLPAALIVAAAYVLAVPSPADAWFLVVQAVVTAVLVRLMRRGGRRADAIIAAGLQAEQDLRAQAAHRADEREQHRQLHDTILSTLTMVAAGAFSGPSATLSAQAARDLTVLHGLPASPQPGEQQADLGACLAAVAAHAAPLQVRLATAAVSVPHRVAELIAASAAEALRNTARHAGVAVADVTVTGGPGHAVVEVTDRGRGFDPGAVPPSSRGIRESIAARMAAAGGSAAVDSRPGTGTTVRLRWPA